MNDIPPHQAREPGLQPDPTLQPDHKTSPVTTTVVALLAVGIVTLVLYGVNASRGPETTASNSSPAQAQDPAAASQNTASNNATDTSKPASGQAKQVANGTAQQGGGNANNPPGAKKTAEPQPATVGQAPAGQPPADAPGAAPAKPNG
jgi:hypothetical protein